MSHLFDGKTELEELDVDPDAVDIDAGQKERGPGQDPAQRHLLPQGPATEHRRED